MAIQRGTWEQWKLSPRELARRVIAGQLTVVGLDEYTQLIYQAVEQHKVPEQVTEILKKVYYGR